MSDWISVKERLPDFDRQVLIFFWGELIDCATRETGRTEGDWFYSAAGGDNLVGPNEVSHWMPLPEPPESKQ